MNDEFFHAMIAARSNDYSWIMPTVIIAGCFVMLLSAKIQNSKKRHLTLLLTGFSTILLSVYGSNLQIVEKWRLRDQWASENQSNLTDEHLGYLAADSANIILGPILIGGFLSASAVFFSAILSVLISRNVFHKNQSEKADRLY